MRRLGVDLLIQAEDEVEDKDADQMQQRAVVCLTCLLLFLSTSHQLVEMELEVLSLELNCNIEGLCCPYVDHLYGFKVSSFSLNLTSTFHVSKLDLLAPGTTPLHAIYI